MQSFRSPRKVVRRLRVAPAAARALKSWPRFVWNYAFGLVPRRPYRFRNGVRLAIGRGVEHVPVIEVFLRGDYGPVPERGVVLDLGASVGTFALHAAASSPGAALYAYEPSPEAFRLLEDNVRMNGLESRVTLVNAAVGARSEPRELYVKGRLFPSLHARGPGAASVQVDCLTLPDVLAAHGIESVALLKLDVEGAEHELLRGTPPETLARVAQIRMEAHDLPGGQDVESLRGLLVERGFRITRETAAADGTCNLWACR